MDNEEKFFKSIELLQDRLKIITDLAVKGIFIHLAISAFAVTFAFQNTSVPKIIIQLANVTINMLAFFSTIYIIKDINRIKLRFLFCHQETEIEIDSNEFKGIIGVAVLYSIFCVVLIIFWIIIAFIPIPTPS